MKKKLNTAMMKAGCGLLAGILAPGVVHACACGCGVFDVGTSSMFPAGSGGTAYFSYAYMNQSRNWSGNAQANAANNDDKQIRTDFLNAGFQYLFNSRWGVQLELPYAYRSFKTTSAAPGNPITTINWGALGDMRLEGLYTGFFADQSAGVTFGLKLPTGDWTYENAYGDVDRDSEIGTGSTDILLGAFYRGNLTADQKWDWFAQASLDVPMLIQARYRPGVELDSAAGIDYKGFKLGRLRISPVAQVIFSCRSKDSGAASAAAESGYERVLVAPGVEFHLHPVKFYADIEIPVFDHVNGNQLIAPVLVKMNVSYMF